MANIIKTGNTPKYRFTCKTCKTSADYDEWEMNEYDDCYDAVCVEYRCPVCGKHNSVIKSDLDKYRVIYVENSDKSTPSTKETTHSTKEIRLMRDAIMIGISLFAGFVGAMLVNSIF